MSVIPLASAYPSTELSAAGLAMMIVVPVGLLFVWLSLIFLAARSSSGRPQPRRQPDAPAPDAVQAASAPATAPHQDAPGTESQLTRSA